MDVAKARRGRVPVQADLEAPFAAPEPEPSVAPTSREAGRPPRRRKRYRVTRPYGPYKLDDIIEPVGLYRDSLLARGVIVLLED